MGWIDSSKNRSVVALYVLSVRITLLCIQNGDIRPELRSLENDYPAQRADLVPQVLGPWYSLGDIRSRNVSLFEDAREQCKANDACCAERRDNLKN